MKKLIIILISTLLFSCSIEEMDKTPQVIPQDGVDGIDGINGTNGVDGNDGLSTWYYVDDNGCYIFFQYHETNGLSGWQETEDREDEDSDPLCVTNGQDGTDGTNGYDSLIRLEVIESGDVCEHGGKKIMSGLDLNRDGYLSNSEVTQTLIWCIEKCPHVCTDVYDTIHCSNNKVYVMWIDGVYYYNIDLQFEQLEDGTAVLYGKVNKHNSTKVFLVDVVFSNIVQESVKNHNCLSVDSSEWIQYANMEGVVQSVDGSINFTVTRRGEPFQVGVGANPTSSKNIFGASGWFITSGHATCQGDFNFNICR